MSASRAWARARSVRRSRWAALPDAAKESAKARPAMPSRMIAATMRSVPACRERRSTPVSVRYPGAIDSGMRAPRPAQMPIGVKRRRLDLARALALDAHAAVRARAVAFRARLENRFGRRARQRDGRPVDPHGVTPVAAAHESRHRVARHARERRRLGFAAAHPVE